MPESKPDRTFVRFANFDDAQRMAEIDRKVNPSPWTVEGFRDSLSTRQGIVGGLEGERIDGFVMYSHVVDDAEILNVAVDPGAQRRGLGKRLIRAMLARVRRDGARHCFLEVRASNIAAQALYAACGFLESGRRADYYRALGRREDALIYTRPLD